MYLDLLTKLELFDAIGVILKYSTDEYISELNRKGSLLHLTCSRCGKELPDGITGGNGESFSQLGCQGSWCAKCSRSVGTCSLCHQVVSGMYVWCPICCHGGHRACLKKWFEKFSTCPSGCGHTCVVDHL